jgi:hypothetical protein
MFTLPDNADASPTCPPISAPGPVPNGFFKDCQTIPTAEDFNELILNLRALLAHAGVPGVKGDPTMLWRCIQQMIPAQRVYTIDSSVTLNVAPGGSANPANPLGGQPFDTLASAFAWLGYYSITSRGSVTIQVADGTYTHGGPLTLHHADGNRISVAGTSPATVLSFPSSSGVSIPGYLLTMTNFSVIGANVGGTVGITVTGSIQYVANVYSQNFDTGIIVQDNGYLGFDFLAVAETLGPGLCCFQGGIANGNHYQANSIASPGGGPNYIAGLFIQDGGRAWIDTVEIFGANKGIIVSGTGAELRVATIDITNCLIAAAVEANDGGAIINSGPGHRGDWNAGGTTGPAYFWANVMALIRADGAFSAGNLANCSPAVSGGSGSGNLGSLIIAS